jgi:hypothetical protein
VSLHTEIDDFVHNHRPHGPLTADATEPAWNGYLLTVACSCGVVFERWVMPEDADPDLVGIARLNWPRCAISAEQALQPAHC